jgi:hypothetical protein
MNTKTNTLFVVNPGSVPSVTFVTSYESKDFRGVTDVRLKTGPLRRESFKRSWTQAVANHPKAFDRFVKLPR